MVLQTGQKLILAFVTLILGVVLIGTIATSSLGVTAKSNAYNESKSITTCYLPLGANWFVNESNPNCNITVTNNPTGWESYDCPLTSVAVRNTVGATGLLNTDYRLYDTTGVIQLLNTTFTNKAGTNTTANNSYSDYTYCKNDYLNSSFGRSTLNAVPGFFALAILAFSLWLFFSVGKDYDIW